MLLENLRIALRSILANKMRSFLTTLGIIIGVGAVIGVVSIVQGLNHWIAGELQGMGVTYILVVPNQDPNDPDMAGREAVLTVEDGRAVLERVPEVVGFTPVFQASVRVRYGDRKASPYVLAVEPDYQEVRNSWVERGRFFSDLDAAAHTRVCAIGRELIENLRLGDQPLGKDITLGSTTFTIVGVMEKQGQLFGQNYDNLVIVPFPLVRELFGEAAEKRILLEFRARGPEDVERAKDMITAVLRQRHRLGAGANDDFRVLLQEEMLEQTSSILGGITKVVGAVVGIALLVGGIGIMNIMLVTVRERTREIGIRKAVGARRNDVLLQFLIEAVTLAAIGGLLGILLGWGLGALGAKAIPGFPSAHVPMWAMLLGIGFASAVGIFFGVYPAAKAASVDPIEALRYE